MSLRSDAKSLAGSSSRLSRRTPGRCSPWRRHGSATWWATRSVSSTVNCPSWRFTSRAGRKSGSRISKPSSATTGKRASSRSWMRLPTAMFLELLSTGNAFLQRIDPLRDARSADWPTGVRKLLSAKRDARIGYAGLSACPSVFRRCPGVMQRRLNRVSLIQLEDQLSDLLAADVDTKVGRSDVGRSIEKFIVRHAATERRAVRAG